MILRPRKQHSIMRRYIKKQRTGNLQKIKVYHFHNGGGGGVLSVIRNILKYSAEADIENHIIHTINKDIDHPFTIDKMEGAVSENIFYYSPKWNFYYTCKQLAKLLPNDKAIIIAHDWLTFVECKEKDQE